VHLYAANREEHGCEISLFLRDGAGKIIHIAFPPIRSSQAAPMLTQVDMFFFVRTAFLRRFVECFDTTSLFHIVFMERLSDKSPSNLASGIYNVFALSFLYFLLICSFPVQTSAQIVRMPFNYGSDQVPEAHRMMQRDIQHEAQKRLRDVLARYPESPAADRATLMLIESTFRSGAQNPDAYVYAWRMVDSFAVARANSPLLPFAYKHAAERYFERARYADAREYFLNTNRASERLFAFSNNKDSVYATLGAESLFWRGAAFMAEAGPAMADSAERTFEQIVSRYPKDVYADDALFFLARFAELERNYEQALAYYDDIAKSYPQSDVRLAAHLRAAQNHLQFRRSARAMAELEAAATFVYSFAVAQQRYADSAEAELAYLRGETQAAGGRYEAALQAFDAVLKKHRQSVFALRSHLGKGFALLMLAGADSTSSLIDQALAEYDAVLDALPDAGANADYPNLAGLARLYRTVALKRKGDTGTETARRELAALSVQSDFPFAAQALLELGELYYTNGKLDDARKTLERAAREAPDQATNIRVNLLLGATALDARLYALAVRSYEEAEQMLGQIPAYQLTNLDVYRAEAVLKRGIALVGAREFREAITQLTRFQNDFPNDERRPEAAFWVVEAQYQADLLQNAFSGYQAFLSEFRDTNTNNDKSNDRTEEALYGLGWTEFRLRRFNEAAATFTRLLREFPATRFALDILTRKGDGLYITKNYRAAADAYREAVRRGTRNLKTVESPSDDDELLTKSRSDQVEYAAFQLGQSLYRLQDYDRAVEAMRDFAKRYPTSPLADDALYAAAWSYFQQRRFADAAQEFRVLVEAYPQGSAAARAYYAMGDSYFNLERYDAAIQAYRTVADLFPLSSYAPDAVNAVQYSYLLQGKEDSASVVADRYINASPGSTLAQEIKFKKAETLFNAGKFATAATEFEDFMKKNRQNPRTAEALYQLGRSFTALQDTAKAFDAFRRVEAEYGQSNYAAAAALETALLKADIAKLNPVKTTSGRAFDEADSAFVRVERLYPADDVAARAAFERATMRETRGDTTEAIQLYRVLAERYAGTDYADRCRYRVAMYFRLNSLFDSARTQLALVVAARTDELGAEAQYRIGELYQREKRFEDAVQAYLKNKSAFAGIEDWYTLALTNMGACYEALKRFEEARETYRLIIAQRGEDDFGRAARERLEKIMKM
jgi:TolA-binding protein